MRLLLNHATRKHTAIDKYKYLFFVEITKLPVLFIICTELLRSNLSRVQLHTAEYINAFCFRLILPSRLSFMFFTTSPSNGPAYSNNISKRQLTILSIHSYQPESSMVGIKFAVVLLSPAIQSWLCSSG